MPRKKDETCCSSMDAGYGNYRVESILDVDTKGQVLLPKDIRERAGIHAGEKLALVSFTRKGKICCLYLFKVDELAEKVKEILGPMTQETAGRGERRYED
ncbi:MAG TPA: AbrB/MazE/SpoVT family DNA-binding domain-containing protein [Candidatus Methanoperedenaceae archaeon]|nr:AbrB/MazE/SpoVT family DNA-binding domain-containing protein [Candidatus Methanoperedenaceae archaeon]